MERHTYLISHFLYSFYTCSIQVVLVSTSLYEQVGLYILLHLLNRLNKVVIPAINLSLTRLTCGICRRQQQSNRFSTLNKPAIVNHWLSKSNLLGQIYYTSSIGN